MKKQQRPATDNIKLRPYQKTKHPFGKPVIYNDIRVFGEETAALFATTEAQRIVAESAMTRKRTPIVANNAIALKKTGQLAGDKLPARFQKKSDTLFLKVTRYQADRPLEKMTYEDVAAVKYILDPLQRETALAAVIDRAKKDKAPHVLQYATTAGLRHKIVAPLDPLVKKLGARTHVQHLQNKMAVIDKSAASFDQELLGQFDALGTKVAILKHSKTRNKLYSTMAAIHPVPKQAKVWAAKAQDEENGKGVRVRSTEPAPKVFPLLKKIKHRVLGMDPLEAAYDTEILINFETLAERVPLLKNPALQSDALHQMGLLHPISEEAAIYSERAWDIAVSLEKGATKATRFQTFRDDAPDDATRHEAHALFVQNADFTQLVTDAVELKGKYRTQAEASSFSEMMKMSHDEIVIQKNATDAVARKALYNEHKAKLQHDTLGYLWKW